MTKPFQSTFLFLAVLLVSGCSGAATDSGSAPPDQSQAQSSPQPSPLTGFEKDLQFIRNGQFTYVWVFSRKDGKPLDKDDSAFLRKNAPQVVDWVSSEDGRKVIAGTNFNLEEGNLAALKQRFVAEDYSGK